MSKYKAQKITSTFQNAGKGWRIVFKSETNIRIHCIVAILILGLALYLDFSAPKICVLLLTIANVIWAEMVNSAIEFSLDAYFHNRFSKMVGMAKDIAAGAVMFNALVAIVIGIILFVPPLARLFK